MSAKLNLSTTVHKFRPAQRYFFSVEIVQVIALAENANFAFFTENLQTVLLPRSIEVLQCFTDLS